MSSVSESRSSKRKLVFPNEEKKKKASVSVWSEEDDISLLKAMIDYEVLNHSSPYADMGKFLHFVNPCLHFDVHRKQLTDRLWRLKHRFLNSNYILSKPHHANLFELSKSIKSWGHDANVSLDGDKGLELVKKKRKLVSRDGQNVKEVHVVLDGGERSKLVKSKKKGKLVTCDAQNDNAVVVEDVDAGKSEQVVKDKNKGNVVACDDQHVEDDNVVVDELDGDGCNSALVVKDKEGEVVISDGRKNTVVVDDVYRSKCSKVVKDKKKKKVVISNNQNVEDDNAAVDDVQSAKKNGKRRVEVLGNQHVPGEVDREDLEYIMSKYPNLTNMLELETLSRMPQHITKNCVIDTIKYMGRGKANKLEEKCADLRLMELELHAKKLDLTNKQIKLILEVARR